MDSITELQLKVLEATAQAYAAVTVATKSLELLELEVEVWEDSLSDTPPTTAAKLRITKQTIQSAKQELFQLGKDLRW